MVDDETGERRILKPCKCGQYHMPPAPWRAKTTVANVIHQLRRAALIQAQRN
jgi:hypothetical protein